MRSFAHSFVATFFAHFAHTKKTRRKKILLKKLEVAIVFVQQSSNRPTILAMIEPFEIRKLCMPFFVELSRSSQDLREADYDSPKSRDDRPNLPKSGKCIFREWSKRDVLFAIQGMSCFEHKECLVSNMSKVLRGTQGMSCFEYKEFLASNTRNVLFATRHPWGGSYLFTYELSLRIED